VSDGVRILHATPKSILLSAVVRVVREGEGPAPANSNIRLFVKEGDEWKCAVWLNYPEPGAS